MFFMPSEGPSWRRLGPTWPHNRSSQFVEAGGMRWHVQRMGAGPTLLLIHGAGASTHSWRDLMADLGEHFDIVAIDLPGHGFSTSPRSYRPTLQRVCSLVHSLIKRMGLDVRYAVGHSAGAAILARMMLDDQINPAGLVSINGAFQPFDGVAGEVFPALAKMLSVNPVTPRVLALSAGSLSRVERIIVGTGSTISDEGLKMYQHLVSSSGHVAGVLTMMANWNLNDLLRDLSGLSGRPFLVVSGEKDRAVPPSIAVDVARHVEGAQHISWPGLGHLAHEEDPALAVNLIVDFAKKNQIIGAPPVKSDAPTAP